MSYQWLVNPTPWLQMKCLTSSAKSWTRLSKPKFASTSFPKKSSWPMELQSRKKTPRLRKEFLSPLSDQIVYLMDQMVKKWEEENIPGALLTWVKINNYDTWKSVPKSYSVLLCQFQIENMEHCDFVPLRNMLIRTHLQDLKEVTNNVHYENFRCRKLAGVAGGSTDKIPNKVSWIILFKYFLSTTRLKINPRPRAVTSKFFWAISNSSKIP